ncbi:MAG: hypothetical protein ACOC0A_01980 [Planctomycetota bacterium]
MTKSILRTVFSAALAIALLSTYFPAEANDEPETSQEKRILKPARELWQNRKYEEAREKLTHIAQENNIGDLGIDIDSLKKLLKRVQGVVEEGYSSLHTKIGRTYAVPLKSGGTMKGEVKDVGDQKVVIRSDDTEHRITLDRIDIERIIRLSVLEYSPDLPKNQALFAVLYTMEGDDDKAREALEKATDGDYEAQEEKSFIRWAGRATETQSQRDKRKAHNEKQDPQQDDEAGQSQEKSQDEKKQMKKTVVLVDRIHGQNLPSVIRRELQKHNVKIKFSNDESYDPEQLKEASVLILVESSSSAPIKQENTKTLTSFLRSGGGLVYFGAKTQKDPALEPLLKAANIDMYYDRLRVDHEAPEEIPKSDAVAGPSGKHPVTRNIGPVVFPLGTCVLDAKQKNTFLISNRHIKSTRTNTSPVVLGASFSLGRGKIVVFGTVPDLYHRKTKKAARRMILNAVAWTRR